MQLFSLTQHVKQYLSDKPELLRKYVSVGTTGVYYAVQSLNAMMKHLILVQGLDPNTVPGERERREFAEALKGVFSYHHEKTFDDEPLAYDFSWVAKKIDADRTPLSKDTIGKLDIDYIQPSVGVSAQTEIRKYCDDVNGRTIQGAAALGVSPAVEPNPVDELARKKQLLQGLADKIRKEASVDDLNPVDELVAYFDEATLTDLYGGGTALAAAMEVLKKYADEITSGDVAATRDELAKLAEEQNPDPKELFARTDYLRDVKQAIRDRYQYDGEENLKAVVSQDAAYKWHTAKDRVEYRAKLAKATELANEMVARNLCEPSKEAIEAQVQEIMKFSDDAFHALKRIVLQKPINKAPVAKKKSPTVKVVKKSKRGSFARSSRKS